VEGEKRGIQLHCSSRSAVFLSFFLIHEFKRREKQRRESERARRAEEGRNGTKTKNLLKWNEAAQSARLPAVHPFLFSSFSPHPSPRSKKGKERMNFTLFSISLSQFHSTNS